MNITLRQLEIFCAIARHNHVGRAANDFGITQSAASMALAELERQLEQPLFDRFAKRLALNGNGKLLLPKAIDLLTRAETIEGLLRGSENTIRGQLKIGASSTIGNYLMPRLIGFFSQQYPDIRMSLQVGNTDQIIHALLNFDIDLAYIEGTCLHPDITSTIWRTDELVIFSSPRHPFAKRKKVTRTELAAANWILREQGSGTREIFEHTVVAKLKNLNVRYELGHTESIKQAVKNNLGISCLSRLTIAEELTASALTVLQTPLPKLTRHFFHLQHKEKYPVRSLELFTAFLQQHS